MLLCLFNFYTFFSYCPTDPFDRFLYGVLTLNDDALLTNVAFCEFCCVQSVVSLLRTINCKHQLILLEHMYLV